MQNETIYVLLADDDEDDRLFFSDAIKELKMNTVVNVVKDGQELIDFLLQFRPHWLYPVD